MRWQFGWPGLNIFAIGVCVGALATCWYLKDAVAFVLTGCR